MKDKILTVLRQFADRETCYEMEELAEAIEAAITPSFSKQVKVVAVPDQDFHGDTFNEKRDGKRLRSLQKEVEDLMSDGRPRSLSQIKEAIGRGTETSLYARLNCAAYSGRWKKEKLKTNVSGLFLYRLLPA